MTKIVNLFIWKVGYLVCLAALLVAHISVNSTCCFSAYQPDVPEKLRVDERYI